MASSYHRSTVWPKPTTPPSLKISVTAGKVAARVASSGQLEAFRNVSVSHVNSKRDLGTEISTREASLRRDSAKNKRILVKMEITVSQSKSQAVKVSPHFSLLKKRGVKCILIFSDRRIIKNLQIRRNKKMKRQHQQHKLLLLLGVWSLDSWDGSSLVVGTLLFFWGTAGRLPWTLRHAWWQARPHWYSPCWQNARLQPTAFCFMSESKLRVDCSILIGGQAWSRTRTKSRNDFQFQTVEMWFFFSLFVCLFFKT